MMMVMVAAITVVIVVMMVMIAVTIMIVIVGTLGIFRIVDVLVIAPMEVVTIIFRIEGEESSVAAIQRQTLAFQQLPHLFLLPRFHIVANVRAAATRRFALGEFLGLAQLQLPDLLRKIRSRLGAGIGQAKR